MRRLLVWIAWNAWAQNNEAMRAALEKQRAAAATQQEAVRKQAELAGPGPLQHFLKPAEVEPVCEPLADSAVNPLIETAAHTQQLDSKLLRAVIRQESSFRPCAVSEHGAIGLMQLMPATIDQFQVGDPFDPKSNIEAGAHYLKQLMDKYKSDPQRALSAYRIGPAVVDQSKGVPDIREVRSYVEAILQNIATEKTATPPAPPQIPTPKPIGN